MGDSDTHSARSSHWERWTGDSGPFYRACAVFPFDTFSEPRRGMRRPEKPAVEFTTGLTRLMLRNLPVVLLVVLAVYIPTLFLNFAVGGRIQITLPSPTLKVAGLLVVGVSVGGLWLYLIYRILAGSLRGLSIHRSVVFFAIAVPLAAGTSHAAYVAWTNTGTESDPAVTVQAGYFLFVLVAGHLVYDGLALKTENLLAELRTASIVRPDAYDEFYQNLRTTLGTTLDIGPVSVSRSAGFALTLALVPILLPAATSSWNRWGMIAYIPYSILTLFVIAVFYDVFVLVYGFTELLRRDILVYQPFHPDERGGFRDLGRFATRVNTILVVAGGYVVYRFFAEGILNLPSDGSAVLVVITWAVIYLGPIGAYVFLVVFWLYHSFWRLHRKMEDGRQRRMEELQRAARKREGESLSEFTDLDADLAVWESLRTAPTWPIKRQSLFAVLIIDAVPVVLAFAQ